jgi:hypothetical protein
LDEPWKFTGPHGQDCPRDLPRMLQLRPLDSTATSATHQQMEQSDDN